MIYDNIKENVSIHKIGGKAYNLRYLGNKNINVPKWFCLTTDFFYAFLDDKLDKYRSYLNNYSETNRKKIINLIEKTEFSNKLKELVNEKLKYYDLISVRSSCTDEDSDNHSFAGMMESYLNIKKEDVFIYIKKCFISCFSQRAMEYRKNNKLINSNISIAVIIMKMIDSKISGVIFTSNPKTNNPDELLISAVKGYGENLVSGSATRSDYTLNIFNEIVSKNENKLIVDKNKLDILANEARKIEKIYKPRRGLDIEFTFDSNRLYILQSRIITTYNYVDKDKERTILDNSNIIESYSGVTTPLTFTFAREVYSKIYHQTLRNFYIPEHAIKSIENDLNNMLYFYENKIYYKLNSWYKMTSLYPGYEKNKKYMENMMGVKTPLEESKVSSASRTIKIYARFLNKMINMKKDSEHFLNKFNEVTKDYRNNKFENVSNKELLKIYKHLENSILDDFTTPIANDMCAMVLYGMLTDKIHKKDIKGGEGLISKVLSKQGNVESVKQTTELIEIVSIIKKDKKLLSKFKKSSIKTLINKLDSDEEIFVKLRNYIATFGARSMEELKLETVTLLEDPTFLFKTIKSYLEIDLDFKIDNKEIDINEILKYYKFIDKCYVKKLIDMTKYFIRNRELLRLRRTYIYDIIRNIFLRIGHNFEESGLIDNYRDIFYLEKDEIYNIIKDKSDIDIKESIIARKKEYNSNKNKETYERMYFYGEVTSKNMLPIFSLQETDDEKGILHGVPGGGKVVEGIVKYISDPNEEFESGYILMAKRTDPGWTILFPMADAIIIERGSILSHSAVVAREMGKTLVVGVRGLTEKIHDGDRIKVDGINGTIELLGDKK